MSATPLLFAAGAGRMSRSASSVVAKAASAFHVFRIDGYSHAKTLLPGDHISSAMFTAGNKHSSNHWQIDCYPNGVDATKLSDFIALYLKFPHVYCGHTEQPVPFQAQYKLRLIDQAGHAAYELPPRTAVFGRGASERGDGYDEFIAREELERRKDLLHDDCLTVRCDVGVTTTELSVIAHGDIVNASDDDDDDDDDSDGDYYGSAANSGGGRRRRRRSRRREWDDKEYVKWCVSKRRG